jgi:hypothetical protein
MRTLSVEFMDFAEFARSAMDAKSDEQHVVAAKGTDSFPDNDD